MLEWYVCQCVDVLVVLHVFGVMIQATLGAMLWYGHTRSLGLSGLRSLAGPALAHAQTLCLTVLVLVEMLKALAAVSLSQSLLTVAPWTNKSVHSVIIF